jgi:hypothetical protein
MYLPTSYFPSIEYCFQLLKNKKVTLVTKEIFPRQTFRNRCIIVNANGLQNLSIPVGRESGHATLTSDIQISYAEDWIKNHLRSIESAYRRTPYYEYYIDAITNILEKKHVQLVELNFELLTYLIEKIGLTCSVERSISQTEISKEINEILNPKNHASFQTKEYLQTFTERFGFQNNLSCLDLLFNEGPNSICILEESGYKI